MTGTKRTKKGWAGKPDGEEGGTPASGGEMSHFLAFAIGDRKLALPLEDVERVIRMAALVPVPEAPEWIAGLLNLHGSVIPVIDLRKRLGLPKMEIRPEHRILIIQWKNLKLGLVAETVEDVTVVSQCHLTAPEGTLKKSALLRAVIQKNDEVYLVLNADVIDSEVFMDFAETGSGQPEVVDG